MPSEIICIQNIGYRSYVASNNGDIWDQGGYSVFSGRYPFLPGAHIIEVMISKFMILLNKKDIRLAEDLCDTESRKVQADVLNDSKSQNASDVNIS